MDTTIARPTTPTAAQRAAGEQAPPRYEEIFRAIGHLLDSEGWCNVCLREHGDGVQIMAQHANDPAGAPVAFALDRGALRDLVLAGQARRGAGRASMLLAAADAAMRGA